jgi:hypothetical protein
MSICIGDLIELDIDSSFNKLAKIIEIKKEKVEAIDLSVGGILIIPLDYLYDKQDLTGMRLKPSEEKDLKLLGANNLWVKLTPKQREKYAADKKEKELLNEKEKKLDEVQMKFLMNFFKISKDEKIDDAPTLNIFSEENKMKENNSPLSKFIKKKE